MFFLNQFVSFIFQQVSNLISVVVIQMVTMLDVVSSGLFEQNFISSLLDLFKWFGIALCIFGCFVAICEVGIEAGNSGKVNIGQTAMNITKGIMSATLFTVLPIKLFEAVVFLQNSILWNTVKNYGEKDVILSAVLSTFSETDDLTQMDFSQLLFQMFSDVFKLDSGVFTSGVQASLDSFMMLIHLILVVYVVIKVLFASIKRAGILFITICTGSLYMFSIPRGYNDGFISWCKQVVAICFTHFIQTFMFVGGFVIMANFEPSDIGGLLISWGVLLAASEVPRIAKQFGIDTSVKENMSSVFMTATNAIRVIKK